MLTTLFCGLEKSPILSKPFGLINNHVISMLDYAMKVYLFYKKKKKIIEEFHDKTMHSFFSWKPPNLVSKILCAKTWQDENLR